MTMKAKEACIEANRRIACHRHMVEPIMHAFFLTLKSLYLCVCTFLKPPPTIKNPIQMSFHFLCLAMSACVCTANIICMCRILTRLNYVPKHYGHTCGYAGFARAKFHDSFCTLTFYFNWPNFLSVGIVDAAFQSAGTGKYATPTGHLTYI